MMFHVEECILYQNFEQGDNDIYISQSQIRRFNLRTGDNVKGITRQAREGERYGALLYVKSVNGDNPQKAVGRPVFENLTPREPVYGESLEQLPDLSSGKPRKCFQYLLRNHRPRQRFFKPPCPS